MIKLGNNDITLKVGSTDVSAAYLGSTLVYSGGTPPTPSFNGKWLATYSDSHTESAECNSSSSAITENEITLTNLAAVEIGDCVIIIGDRAFSGCTSLSSLTIGSGVINIGNGAFFNCKSLTSVTIPNSVETIGSAAFIGCASLTSVTIPNGVTSIESQTFRSCTGLTNVTIPSGVTNISARSFYDCSSLTSITINAITPPTLANTSAFTGTNDCPIYVPAQSVSAYQSANNWSQYASRIQAIP